MMSKNKPTHYLLWLLFCYFECASADVHEVVVQDNNFTPANITIQAGDTVRWENLGNNNHNVVSTDFNYLFRCANGCIDTGGDDTPAGNGWVAEVTFHHPDSNIPYVCEPHVGFGMTGSVSVQTPYTYQTITVTDMNGFVPQNLTIEQSSRVQFVNGNGVHNLVADDDSFKCADGCRDDGVEGDYDVTGFAWQFFMQFREPGTYTYHCENPGHNESGVIHVLGPIFVNGFEQID